MTEQEKISKLASIAFGLTNLTSLNANFGVCETMRGCLSPNSNEHTLKRANAILEEHFVMAPLSRGISRLAEEILDIAFELEVDLVRLDREQETEGK